MKLKGIFCTSDKKSIDCTEEEEHVEYVLKVENPQYIDYKCYNISKLYT